MEFYGRDGECDDEEKKARIDRLHRLNLHKLRLMPKFEMDESDR
jgi:NAD+ synthase